MPIIALESLERVPVESCRVGDVVQVKGAQGTYFGVVAQPTGRRRVPVGSVLVQHMHKGKTYEVLSRDAIKLCYRSALADQ